MNCTTYHNIIGTVCKVSEISNNNANPSPMVTDLFWHAYAFVNTFTPDGRRQAKMELFFLPVRYGPTGEAGSQPLQDKHNPSPPVIKQVAKKHFPTAHM